jgi:serine/threonine protein kinase
MTLERIQGRLKGKGEMEQRASWPNGYKLGGRYKITKQLATTACSQVYLAEDTYLSNQKVVVKRLKPDKLEDNDACRRFEREVLVLRKITDRHILAVYSDEVAGPDRYFVTEFADKGTLKEYLESTPFRKLRPIEALEIALSACEGLEAAHREDIIHRDVKPGNIFLFSGRSGGIVAKLGDFSVSRVPGDSLSSPLTEVGSFIGTRLYASPEQVSLGTADERSDIYSWAVVFFEMLTGQSPTDSLKDPLKHTPTSDRFKVSFFTQKGIPDKLAAVLQKNLIADPSLRHPSTAELRGALERIQSQVRQDIEQHLTAGETHIRSSEWQAANDKFEQGLAWCGRAGDFDELSGSFRALASKLWKGHLCAQGMIYLTQRRWPQAIEALKKLQRLDSNYLGLKINEQLRKAQSELQRKEKYQHLLQLKEEGRWVEILRLARELTTNYRGIPEGESVGEIRKLALYAEARELSTEAKLEEAYDRLYRLYETDPNYEDVTVRCANMAFLNAMREDIPASKEHQVAWLEKVVEIVPLHREGRTRRQLAEAHEALGDEKHKDKRHPEAIKHWKRALKLSPGRKGTLRRKIRKAQFRAHGRILNIWIVLALIEIVLAALGIWQPWREQGQNSPVATLVSTAPTEVSMLTLTTFPTRPMLTPTPSSILAPAVTFTPIVTPSPNTPTSTPTVPTPTPTCTPTWTFTPTPTPTPSPTNTATPTPTSTDTPTPTLTPVSTATHTPAATRRWLPAPTLIAPDNGASFTGWNAEVILQWSTVEGIAQEEYYVVRIPYDDAGGVAEFWRQKTSFRVPAHYSGREVGFPDRHYNWSVQVMQCTEKCDEVLDDNVKKQGIAVGDKSAERMFCWHPDIVGGRPSTDDTTPSPPPTPDE